MILFGHLGIGYRLTKPWHRCLSARWLLAGTIAPDVLDKSAYLVSEFFVHPPLAMDPFFSGTRTVGHSLLFLLLVSVVSRLARSRAGLSLAAGIVTHLLLDCLTPWLGSPLHTWSYTFGVLLWPLQGWNFPVKLWESELFTFKGIFKNPWLLLLEAVGLWFLRPLFLAARSRPR
jgi:membrane-bound metal-dependent hydrolase YbcI (DUF457 family)